MDQDNANKWSLRKLALYGLIFGIGYGILRLSWGAGEPPDLPNAAQDGGYLIGTIIGGGLVGAFLAVMIGLFRNLMRR